MVEVWVEVGIDVDFVVGAGLTFSVGWVGWGGVGWVVGDLRSKANLNSSLVVVEVEV